MTVHPTPGLVLRDATEGDVALTYAITEDAMRGYVEKTWGAWDAHEERKKHARSFTPASHKIILADGAVAGCVAIEDFPTYTWLVKIYLLSQFRNFGIGSTLLRQFIGQSAVDQKPLRLQVLRVNRRAQKLYFQHGFKIAHETADRLFLQI